MTETALRALVPEGRRLAFAGCRGHAHLRGSSPVGTHTLYAEPGVVAAMLDAVGETQRVDGRSFRAGALRHGARFQSDRPSSRALHGDAFTMSHTALP
ncbi:hypothetical protein GALLR39Z86_03100 [Glycomyces algeriensis]|uniref:Uncharacterized protein n=1 Tax=Glycomyces algeriensis TaxID=256037 RepID=A0A9W6G3R8_9ACTN|nr:hypothetical protein GALLR39Z86_03100 [Glycomyces algeriensis]